MLIIGLMSGTSADGVDAAVVEISGKGRRTRIVVRGTARVEYEPGLRDSILLACESRVTAADICALDGFIGAKFAQAACLAARSAGVGLLDIDAIGSHGQTIWHQPRPTGPGQMTPTGTFQLGNAALIAAGACCRVVSNFRAADMAAGGQGAPLVPYADWVLLTSGREARAVQNLGGIANVTHLPRNAHLSQVIAFDTGPGNMVMDGLVRHFTGGTEAFDRDGSRAARGRVCEPLLASLLDHRYFAAPPPKSTGREMFGEAYVRSVVRAGKRHRLSENDLLATACALTAESIRQAYERWIVPRGGARTVILGGGGVENPALVDMLRDRLAPASIARHEEFGIPGQAKEAAAFAILAYETLHSRPSNVPSATGARYPAVLGQITSAPPRGSRPRCEKQGAQQ